MFYKTYRIHRMIATDYHIIKHQDVKFAVNFKS